MMFPQIDSDKAQIYLSHLARACTVVRKRDIAFTEILKNVEAISSINTNHLVEKELGRIDHNLTITLEKGSLLERAYHDEQKILQRVQGRITKLEKKLSTVTAKYAETKKHERIAQLQTQISILEQRLSHKASHAPPLRVHILQKKIERIKKKLESFS